MHSNMCFSQCELSGYRAFPLKNKLFVKWQRGCNMNIINTTHHDIFVDEASSIPCRFQMWVFFRAGNSDIPDLFPGIIKLNMYRIDSRMVWSHCIAQISWNTMFLKHNRTMTAFKNLRNLMFWHFSNPLFVRDQEQA